MELRTTRLLLRPWQRAYLDAMAEWPRYPDPLDAPWNWPQQLKAQGTADLFYLMRSSSAGRREWTIATHGGAIVGHLGIREIRPRASARLGLGLGLPHIGQGYGREALTAFLDQFFGPLHFSRMLLDVAVHNERARQLYTRLGFREAGASWRPAGPPADFAFLREPAYAALRDNFRLEGEMVLVRSIEMALAAHAWAPGARE